MRIAYTPPHLCSSCFGQYPEMTHVDFEAAWDGPAVNNDGTPYSIDELVICEDCLRVAAALLPEDEKLAELRRQNEELLRDNRELRSYAESMASGIMGLERALTGRPESVQPAAPRNKRPRPKHPAEA